jgi:maleate cis-trans isomerase
LGAEDEYLRFAQAASFPLAVRIAYTDAEDSHAPGDLRDTASVARLLDGARRLADWRPRVVSWACTSGSFIVGVDGARAQVAAISRELGVPAGSTSLAFGDAAAALGMRRVAVLSPYPPQASEAFVAFLADLGVEVVRLRRLDCHGPSSSVLLQPEALRREIAGVDGSDAEAVLLPDTAVSTLHLLESLTHQQGKPVLTANQVTIWQALRLAGSQVADPRLGVLARRPLPGRDCRLRPANAGR